MNDAPDPLTDEGGGDATMRLLRLAGPRVNVPHTRAARVKAAVHGEWQLVARRRAVRRRLLVASTFLTAAVVLTIGWFNLVDRPAPQVGEPVAIVEQINGMPQRRSDTAEGAKTAGLSRGNVVRTGEWIETDAAARAALRFSDGTSVRLDVGSRVRPLSSSTIELAAGAVYVDSGRELGRFEVRTAMATALDVGTQFEVRLLDRAVRLRVRTGVVELKDRARSVSGRAGTEVTLSATDAISRPIAAHGSEWEWATRVSPPLEMEGMSLVAFLERVAREHGWVIQYADPAIAREAARIILHGSISGLAPQEAVQVAVTTSGLRYRLENGALLVHGSGGTEGTDTVNER